MTGAIGEGPAVNITQSPEFIQAYQRYKMDSHFLMAASALCSYVAGDKQPLQLFMDVRAQFNYDQKAQIARDLKNILKSIFVAKHHEGYVQSIKDAIVDRNISELLSEFENLDRNRFCLYWGDKVIHEKELSPKLAAIRKSFLKNCDDVMWDILNQEVLGVTVQTAQRQKTSAVPVEGDQQEIVDKPQNTGRQRSRMAADAMTIEFFNKWVDTNSNLKQEEKDAFARAVISKASGMEQIMNIYREGIRLKEDRILGVSGKPSTREIIVHTKKGFYYYPYSFPVVNHKKQ